MLMTEEYTVHHRRIYYYLAPVPGPVHDALCMICGFSFKFLMNMMSDHPTLVVPASVTGS